MIDTHTHLDHLDDPDAAVAAATAAGVHGMISIGCSADSIRKTLAIARRHESCVRIAAGVHPLSAAEFDLSTFDEIAELAADALVVGIGETGFDQYHDAGTLAQQQPAFDLQVELARALGKPLIIHTRDAARHTLDVLAAQCDGVTVVLHCFSLPEDTAEIFAHPDWYCSFAGNTTYKSAESLRVAAAAVPDDRILIETDAPYLSPVPHRGKRNEPAFVPHTLACIAEARGLTVAAADELTTRNAVRAFGLPTTWLPAGGA